MKVLFLDDDTSVLDGLKRIMFSQKSIWEMDFFAEPGQALQAVEKNRYDVVISDLQMSEMNGVEFLEQVQTFSPETIRFILTGVIDHPLHSQAMRTAHQVIGKPCRPEVIKGLIQRAFQLKAQLETSELASVLTRVQSLPSLPEAHQKVLDYLSSSSANPRGLGKLISEDVGMSAKIMQIANSAYYDRPGKIHNPVQAVVFLGMKTVEAMVLTVGIFSRLDRKIAAEFSISSLQAHCVRVGVLARTIAMDLQLPPETTDQASMAGILHDAGKIVMLSQFTDKFTDSIQRSRRSNISLCLAEKQLFGFSHAELGALLMQLWTLPGDIIESTAFHYQPWRLHQADPESVNILSLPDVIYLANTIDEHYCSGWTDGSGVHLNNDYIAGLGLTEQYQTWLDNHLASQKQELEYAA